MGYTNDYEWFEYEMVVNGLQHLLVKNFEEAVTNDRENNMVFIPNEENGKFDIYLTAKKNGVFGEYVCWVSDEFLEDSSLVYNVVDFVVQAYKSPDLEKAIRTLNPNIRFTPYEKKDYPHFYSDAVK